MRKIKQTLFGGPEGPNEEIGNCYPTCIASILEIDLVDVPHFYQIHRDNDKAHKLILTWFRSKNLCPINYDIADWMFDYFEGMIGILSGKSPRGDFKHAVVGKLENKEWKILHDPHPSDDGLDGAPTNFEILVPLNYWSE